MGFIDRLGPEYGPLIDNLHELQHHSTKIFPEDTANICKLSANVLADIWSDWAEIVDDPGGNTLTSKFTKEGHVTAMVVEDSSVVSSIFVVEVAYGTPKVIVSRFRVQSETNKLPTAESPRVRSDHIPAGETIHYKCMCEAANTPAESIEVHFRYFLHGE